MEAIKFRPIGIIHTPHKSLKNMPIQPAGAEGIKGTVELFEEFRPGLDDLDGFSHIVLLYYLHESREFNMHVVPYLDTVERGLFATRAPKRPNAIGLSVVELEKIENGEIHIVNVDMLDSTPLLDIKPYVPEFDSPTEIRLGWLEHVLKDAKRRRSDGRFT
jgi:tRNA-Thr(GGU) m(6)t(6)A37 methyltransferase TsaA